MVGRELGERRPLRAALPTADQRALGTPDVTFADVTGDGAKEAIVKVKCPSSTSRPPLKTFVYDGASSPPNLQLLLTIGASDFFRTMNNSNGTGITVNGDALSLTTPLCCPELSISETYVWRGFQFERTTRSENPLPGTILHRTSAGHSQRQRLVR